MYSVLNIKSHIWNGQLWANGGGGMNMLKWTPYVPCKEDLSLIYTNRSTVSLTVETYCYSIFRSLPYQFPRIHVTCLSEKSQKINKMAPMLKIESK